MRGMQTSTKEMYPRLHFAPYFPADEPQKFASVHKVFGASNVNKMLQESNQRLKGREELPEHQRSDAVSSMVYEANTRVRDPVYGCVGAISSLQQQIDSLQTQLALAQAEVVQLRMRHVGPPPSSVGANLSENVSSQDTKSLFSMDMVEHHHHHHEPSFGGSLWSC